LWAGFKLEVEEDGDDVVTEDEVKDVAEVRRAVYGKMDFCGVGGYK